MPRPKVEDKKIKKGIKIRISLIEDIRKYAEIHKVTEVAIIEQGIEMFFEAKGYRSYQRQLKEENIDGYTEGK